MATVVTRRNTFYGYPNPQGNQFPDPIVANRAPTQSDKAVIGQLWVYPGTNSSYILSSINSSGQSVWTVLNIGGAGVFSSLQVNGPSTFNGNITQIAGVTSLLQTTINGSLTQDGGATLLNTDAIAQTVNIGTGAAAKTVSLGSTNTTSTTTINSGSGNINLNGTTVISKAGLVLQTNCTVGGATSVQSIQLSDENSGVLYSTLKRYTTGTITAGDRLYLHLINGQQGGADRLAAAIDSFSQTVGAGFVSANLGFYTTNNAGANARRLEISSQGQINIETAGQTLGIKQGANAMAGTIVLDGLTGSFTQANTQVDANSIILLSRVNVNGASGAALTYTINPNTSFTVTARDATTGLAVNSDNSTIAYMIVQLVP